MTAFGNMKQDVTEKVRAFSNWLQTKALEIFKDKPSTSEKAQIHAQFVKGLLPKFRRYVLEKNSKTLEEAISDAELLEINAGLLGSEKTLLLSDVDDVSNPLLKVFADKMVKMESLLETAQQQLAMLSRPQQPQQPGPAVPQNPQQMRYLKRGNFQNFQQQVPQQSGYKASGGSYQNFEERPFQQPGSGQGNFRDPNTFNQPNVNPISQNPPNFNPAYRNRGGNPNFSGNNPRQVQFMFGQRPTYTQETRDCFNCGKRDHLQRDCRLSKRQLQPLNSRGNQA